MYNRMEAILSFRAILTAYFGRKPKGKINGLMIFIKKMPISHRSESNRFWKGNINKIC